LQIKGEEFAIERHAADGDKLVLFISPGFGDRERVDQVSRNSSALGIEIWNVDIQENLFLPRSVSSLRMLDGSYVAGLIAAAHELTGKHVTVMGRGYSSIAVLRGVHQWQQAQIEKTGSTVPRNRAVYLDGVILISPELYQSIPDLGLQPEFVPVAASTNIPIMIFQGGSRGNRWQLENTIAELGKGNAEVYFKIFGGVTGIFYDEDKAEETLQLLETLHLEIRRAIKVLAMSPTPARPVPLAAEPKQGDAGLDTSLKPFRGDPKPLPLDLVTARGEHVVYSDYTGKVTVVNFWATWCPPCVEEIPSLNRLRKKMENKPFQLISVDYAEEPEKIREFLEQVKVDFPVLLDHDGKVSASWNVIVFPSTFVIGPSGEIVYGVKGGIHWDTEEVVNQLNRLIESPAD
jgi:thiol-disulfide isomerase/thioredoxin